MYCTMYIADFSFCAFQRRYANKSWDHALLLTGLDLYTAPDSDLGKCRPCKFSLKNKKSWDHALLLTGLKLYTVPDSDLLK